MISYNRIALYIVVGLAFALLGCAPQGLPVTGETPTSSGSPDLPAQAVLDAQQWLAAQLSVAADQVQLVEAEQAEWSDSCLGLGRPEESCLQAVTPGWRAVFEINGQRYEVRTDQTGSVIRVASPEGLPTGLENTHWSLVSFGAPGAEQPLVEGSTITLMLAGGQAGGSGGCNSYGGTYQVDGNSITFSEITRTEMACLEEGVTEQEQRYFEALETASEYRVEGDQLHITYDGGNGLMIFDTSVPAGPTSVTPTPG
ncbi:MAG TPA: META domain-containing protein [Anaerolineales bacterium]|nr:META domain-containing protein [Anaerolineales bacterium]